MSRIFLSRVGLIVLATCHGPLVTAVLLVALAQGLLGEPVDVAVVAALFY